MGRYFLRFSYIGTQYRGLQKNIIASNYVIHDPDTVQGALESALSTLIPKSINWPKLVTSSRTDVGVHALYSSAHVDLHNKYNYMYRSDDVLSCVNRYFAKCNHDIRLLEITPVTDDFHVRFLAKSRTYLYRVIVPKDPNDLRMPIAEKNKCFLLRSPTFDVERLKRATRLFMGTKDFRTFSGKPSSEPVQYVRQLNAVTVEKGQPFMPLDPLSENFEFWNITVSARSFLYNQVRRMVAALLSVATGTITEKDVVTMLQVPGRHNWLPQIHVAPACGLYLVNIEYCPEELDKYIIKIEESDFKAGAPVEEDEAKYVLQKIN